MFIRNIYHYLSSEPLDTTAFKIIRLFFFGVALILFAWFLYFAFSTIVMPYQIEYREGAAQVMMQILLKGGNPFSMEYQPLGMNNYGIGYSLFALPFAKLFGNTLMVHRSVNFCFLFASLLIVARTIWILKQDKLFSILGSIFIAVVLAGRGGLGAFPSTMGAFLFFLVILIPFIYSFRYPSLLASALLAILAFYTKPYFVIGFGVVAAYTFIFISKQKGVVYSLFFLSVFVAFFAGIRHIFEFYFIDTLVSNLSNSSPVLAHLYNQLVELNVEFFPSILLGLVLLLFNLPTSMLADLVRKGFPARSNFLQLDTPLLNVPLNYFAFTFIFCFLGFIFSLGLHLGNYMVYAYQIVLPPFILWLFHTLNLKTRFSIIALSLLLGNILMLENILLQPAFLLQSDSVAWRDLYTYVRNSQRVVNSPAVVSALIDAGITPVDSGQTEYYYRIKPYPDNVLVGPGYEIIKGNGITYLDSIQNDARDHKFDRIFTTDGGVYGNLLSFDLISQSYTKIDTLTIIMPQTHQIWTIGVWEPLGE